MLDHRSGLFVLKKPEFFRANEGHRSCADKLWRFGHPHRQKTPSASNNDGQCEARDRMEPCQPVRFMRRAATMTPRDTVP